MGTWTCLKPHLPNSTGETGEHSSGETGGTRTLSHLDMRQDILDSCPRNSLLCRTDQAGSPTFCPPGPAQPHHTPFPASIKFAAHRSPHQAKHGYTAVLLGCSSLKSKTKQTKNACYTSMEIIGRNLRMLSSFISNEFHLNWAGCPSPQDSIHLGTFTSMSSAAFPCKWREHSP